MFRKSLLLLMLFPVLGIIMMACGKHKAYICSVYMGVAKDTVTGVVTFVVNADDHDMCFQPTSNPFFGSCYAMSRPCAKWMNDFDYASFRLSFDKRIIVGTDTLRPGENILDRPGMTGNEKFTRETGCNYIDHKLELKANQLQQMIFDTGLYKATFTCKTTDGHEMEGKAGYTFKQ